MDPMLEHELDKEKRYRRYDADYNRYLPNRRRRETRSRIEEALNAANQLIQPAQPRINASAGLGNVSPISPVASTGPNGRLDISSLTSIGGGHYLRSDAANAWEQMRAAAAAQGITLTVGDSYRDYATQQRLAAEKGLYSKGGLAAVPGTSKHGLAVAVDVGEGAQRDWLARHGNRYGFNTIPREPWHWEYG